MPVSLLFLEFIGTTELLVIAFVALIIFGPRKLPELGRSLGRSLGEFKRASEDFKRTWEYEVEVEKSERERRLEEEAREARVQLAGADGEAGVPGGVAAADAGAVPEAELLAQRGGGPMTYEPPAGQTIARGPSGAGVTGETEEEAPGRAAPAGKQDWL